MTEAIHSVLGQSYELLELVVVDDGSTDDTRAILSTVDDPRLRVVITPHRGIGAALNEVATLLSVHSLHVVPLTRYARKHGHFVIGARLQGDCISPKRSKYSSGTLASPRPAYRKDVTRSSDSDRSTLASVAPGTPFIAVTTSSASGVA